jgi:hypothetical protein
MVKLARILKMANVIPKELKNLINDDYQKRGGNYPKPNIPDTISVSIVKNQIEILFDFKNTSENITKQWLDSSSELIIINKFSTKYDIEIITSHDGDFPDDWVNLTINLIKKSPTTKEKSKSKEQTNKPVNNKFIYTYMLSNSKQKDSIDLTKYTSQIQTICKEYFKKKLLSIDVNKDGYTLKLNEEFTIGEKRRLGKLFAIGTDLKEHVKKVTYNNGQDKSGQLFIIKKEDKSDEIIK